MGGLFILKPESVNAYGLKVQAPVRMHCPGLVTSKCEPTLEKNANVSNTQILGLKSARFSGPIFWCIGSG